MADVLDDLRAQVASLQQRLDRAPDKLPEPAPSHMPRLAITVRSPYDDSYPTEEELPNTYWIVFVDGTYAKGYVGNLYHTLNPRQALTKARITAHNLLDGRDAYCELFTLIAVFWQNGRWWFYHGGAAEAADSSSTLEDSGSSSGDSSSGESGSGDSSSGSSSGECVTPASLGLPPAPDNGDYVLALSGGCLTWKPLRSCTETTSSSSSSGV